MTSFENTPDEISSDTAGRRRKSSFLPTWMLTRKFTPELIPSEIRFASDRLPISSQIIICGESVLRAVNMPASLG